ncbi:hypothetical protein TESG_08292 [Trichophyton tonsurans CBS 112818]|uniref:Uncharacterized protein n=1 Tax=Trichophyton tonsurans (strain CBS 112818) TaxID=647933 RepID=F2RQV4_TRIT1|nr:hypothetical protein TESG_08292 [Trichophyton tonsurans CBS 112818]
MALVYLVALKIPPSSVSRGTINASAQKQVQTRRRSTSHSNMRYYARANRLRNRESHEAKNKIKIKREAPPANLECMLHAHYLYGIASHQTMQLQAPFSTTWSRTRSWMLSRPAISFRMEFSLEEGRGRRLVAGSKGEAAGTVNGDLQESIED